MHSASHSRRLFAAVCLALAACGCASYGTLEFDVQNPAVRYSDSGVFFGESRVMPGDVPKILRDYGVPRDRVIHIRIDPGTRDLGGARRLMNCLAANGYTRPVLVTKKHAEAVNNGAKGRRGGVRPRVASPAKAPVRYKRADE